MSIEVMAQVWPLDLPPAHKLILLDLANHAHDDGTHAYPGVRLLCEKSGLSRRRVQTILRELEGQGLILAADGKGGGRGRATSYTVLPKGAERQNEKGAIPAKGAATDTKGRNPEQERVQLTAPQPSGTVIEPSLARTAGKRDLLFEAICTVSGKTHTQLTKTEHSILSKVTAELKAVGATPDEVVRRAFRWHAKFADAQLTETALLKHWGRLVPPQEPKPRSCPPHRFIDTDPERGRYCVLCKGWLP